MCLVTHCSLGYINILYNFVHVNGEFFGDLLHSDMPTDFLVFNVNISHHRYTTLWSLYLAKGHFHTVFAKVWTKCTLSALHLAYSTDGTPLDTCAKHVNALAKCGSV